MKIDALYPQRQLHSYIKDWQARLNTSPTQEEGTKEPGSIYQSFWNVNSRGRKVRSYMGNKWKSGHQVWQNATSSVVMGGHKSRTKPLSSAIRSDRVSISMVSTASDLEALLTSRCLSCMRFDNELKGYVDHYFLGICGELCVRYKRGESFVEAGVSWCIPITKYRGCNT
jgi:hypothetical protein